MVATVRKAAIIDICLNTHRIIYVIGRIEFLFFAFVGKASKKRKGKWESAGPQKFAPSQTFTTRKRMHATKRISFPLGPPSSVGDSSELGGPSGKLFRFVSCVRARGAYVRSDLGENLGSGTFPFPFWPWEVFPFPSALQGPIQLQLALSVGPILENKLSARMHQVSEANQHCLPCKDGKGHNGWLRTRRMVKDTTDDKAYKTDG